MPSSLFELKSVTFFKMPEIIGYRVVNDPENRPDPNELLEAFVASNRSEKAFSALVENLSGLVYSSALRRTRNSQLAEEIAQNVFAIMARKAESLRRHPSLTAWALETTRLQSASAMRSEKRRLRKIVALTREAESRTTTPSDPMKQEPSWKDAVFDLDEALDRLRLKDRKIILQRFYEGKAFKEIATENGQTEAACKMRLKRALQKMATLLKARGVTLSGAALASALGVEFAQAAPAQLVGAMAPKALAASSSIPASTLVAHTLQTMTTSKTITCTTAAVVAVAAIPFFQQRAEGGRIQSELDALAEQRSAPEAAPLIGRVNRPNPASEKAVRRTEARTAESLLVSLGRPVEHRAFIRDLMEVTGIPDPLGADAAWSRVQAMNPEERKELIRAVREFPMHRATKSGITMRILEYSEMTPREQVEELIARGTATGGQHYLRDWAASEPDAAMKWFWEKRASGELDRGLDNSGVGLYEWLLGDLLGGLARENPAKALDLYRKLPKEEIDENDMRYLAVTIAMGEIERGEQRYYREMLETHSGEDRKAILRGILFSYVGAGLFDEGMAVVDDYVQSPEERFEYIEGIFENTGLPFWKIAIGLDWVLASTSESEAPAAIRRVVSIVGDLGYSYALEWIERQEPGGVRDHAYAGWVEKNLDSTFTDDFPRVLPAAEKIEDPALRAEIRQLIRQKWNEQDKAKASQYLPADVLEQLEKL